MDWLVAAAARRNPLMLRRIFALDRKCGRIVLSVREPIIGQMRLAWWRDVLRDGTKGRGEPLADALRSASAFPACEDHLVRIVDGWEELCVAGDSGEGWEEAVTAFARLRGGGLFGAVGAAEEAIGPQNEKAGAAWALWDLAGQLGPGERRDIVLRQAASFALSADGRALPRPTRILALLSHKDVARGRPSPSHMTPGLYARVLRAQFLGR
ncbi:squalene/phytoene synthase family protein [Sphingobium subterraneum]|uniref:Phytoene synthase n=1 Tax=Sphingobium subterraneum TaxID=627688 RepID=A0A841J1D2_9SPHN|nr:squalene/phytoene synthase family protein [Sphingobium subterraneum]MBB6122475.1 phytoene synthase [Sphingobium subterraneum]